MPRTTGGGDVEGCVFCGIAAGEIPATIVFEDDDFVAFEDLNPKAPVHVLVVPRQHSSQVGEMEEHLFGPLLKVGVEVAARMGIEGSGYRFVINTGDDGGQTVGHTHLHVLGGRRLSWPPG